VTLFLILFLGVLMPCVIGYLRHHKRWNGEPGLGLEAQKELVRQAVRELNFEQPRYRYLVEQRDGQSQGWPALKKAIRLAQDEEEGLLVVIPTLDGVQFNSSFLGLLVYRGFDERPPIYVCSGWRRPKRFAKDTNFAYRAEWRGWLLSLNDQAEAFEQVVRRARSRNSSLPNAIRKGLREARKRGVRLGANRPGGHQFTQAEQSKGGQATGQERRRLADAPYQRWISAIRRWRDDGQSLRQIAMLLADKRVTTPQGRRIGPMLVHRILRRAGV
jgi:hypothetical protein